MKSVILDNGAMLAKLGFSDDQSPKVLPNCIMKAKSERRRPFIGNQIEDCRDASGLYYILNFQRGYLINWDTQKTVWDYMFSADCLPANFIEHPLLITQPIYNFHSIQEAMTEILFEEYELEHLYATTAPDLAAHRFVSESSAAKTPLCCLVIDIGFSFTHIVPVVKGRKIRKAIRRVDVGGKLLTNHLKELISYRQLNVMDESYVINQVKEDACFVSQNFMDDMRTAKRKFPDNTIVRDYVLPDFTTIRRGYLREPTKDLNEEFQILKMNNERFSIPEILFHPSDVGINQMGIAEAAIDAINACKDEIRPHLFANIIVCGGSALFFGMRARLQKEIRALAPEEFDVHVTLPNDAITYSWQGGKLLSKNENFLSTCISRKDYEENGAKISIERFDI